MTSNNFKSFFVLVFMSLFFITSCSKDSGTSSTTTTPTTGTGTTTSTCSFMPYKKGTKITEVVNGTTYNFTLTDTVVKGLTYLNANAPASYSAGISYIRQGSNGEIIQYVPAQNNGGLIIPEFFTTLLKPNESVGASWTETATSSVSGSSYSNIYNYKIIEKGFTATILGKTYTNCIKVQNTLSVSVAGQTQVASVVYYYYACGFGFYKANDQASQLNAEVTALTL